MHRGFIPADPLPRGYKNPNATGRNKRIFSILMNPSGIEEHGCVLRFSRARVKRFDKKNYVVVAAAAGAAVVAGAIAVAGVL